jgi:hypothetical protein
MLSTESQKDTHIHTWEVMLSYLSFESTDAEIHVSSYYYICVSYYHMCLDTSIYTGIEAMCSYAPASA